jgi:hypothetical protein
VKRLDKMAEYETILSKTIRHQWKPTDLDSLGEEGLQEPKIVTVQLIDPSTKEIFDAKAEVCSIPGKLPGADNLWVRDDTDYRGKGPKKLWAIKIIQRLGEEEEEETGPKTPKYAGRLGQRRGYMIRSLIEEDEASNH